MDVLSSLPLLQIHLTAVFTTLVLVVISDLHALLWIIGKMETLPYKRMQLFHRAVWVGLAFIISAGVSMFLSYPEYLLSLPAFQLKAIFILFLLINAFFIGKHLRSASERTFSALPRKEKVMLLVSGFVSTLGWIGAYTCAQFLS